MKKGRKGKRVKKGKSTSHQRLRASNFLTSLAEMPLITSFLFFFPDLEVKEEKKELFCLSVLGTWKREMEEVEGQGEDWEDEQLKRWGGGGGKSRLSMLVSSSSSGREMALV